MGKDDDVKKLGDNKDFLKAIFHKNIKMAQGIAFKELGDRERVFTVVDHYLHKKK